ncbi:MAG TPA: thiamine-monophosphate kinase [Aciduliprofundum sp.]|nr:thiamine-monophosphate kinase [Aciduliprofundum sp.]
MAKISEVGEECLVRRILKLLSLRGADAHEYDSSGIFLTVDQLVQGYHFPGVYEPRVLGKGALRVSLSDLAAVGAEPIAFADAILVPGDADVEVVEGIIRGLAEDADYFDLAPLGGDTKEGPLLSVSVTALGLVDGRRVGRCCPSSGDLIVVSGPLGRGFRAFEIMQGDPLEGLRMMYLFEPRIEEGQELREVASSMTDLSDGLFRGVRILASGLGARVDLDSVPLVDGLGDPVEALSFGQDYELLATVPRDADLPEWAFVIGEVGGGSFTLVSDGREMEMPRGWTHFGKR